MNEKHRFNITSDLYAEEQSVEPLFSLSELDPQIMSGKSTVGTISTGSTMSCPGGCVYTWTTASSRS